MSYGTTVLNNSVMKLKKSNLKLDVLSLVQQNLLKLTNSKKSLAGWNSLREGIFTNFSYSLKWIMVYRLFIYQIFYLSMLVNYLLIDFEMLKTM